MNPSLGPLLAGMAVASAALAVALVVTKLVHREVLRWKGVRAAQYVAAIGELASRGIMPTRIPRGWAADPLFHDVISDYRLMVTGKERQFLDELATGLGIHQVLVARTRRRFPKTSRLRALSSLVDLATPAQVHHLRSLLDEPDGHARTHAVRGLARLRDVDSIPAILQLATTAKAWETARIADSLVDMGATSVEEIVAWVNEERLQPDPSIDVISLAARVLGLLADPRAEPLLISLLESNQSDWRLAAASALEHTGGEAAKEPLCTALEDRDWRVRARVAVALGALADDSVARPVSTLLYDPVWWVRQNAATALAAIPGGTEQLLAVIDGPDPYAADAALHQLTTSGVLADAQGRVETGTGTDRDRHLAAVAGGL